MHLSQRGFDLLKSFEGFSASVYHDAAGYPTIGYGHCLQEGEHYTQISQEEAEQLLRRDVEVAAKAIHTLVSVPLTQYQFDALVCFVYNIGIRAFEKSTLRRVLNAGDYARAAVEFLRWIYAGGQELNGLRNRREKESELFINGLS